MSFDGGNKVVILDEADYLNPQSTQPALRAFIEEFERSIVLLFLRVITLIVLFHHCIQDVRSLTLRSLLMINKEWLVFMRRIGYI